MIKSQLPLGPISHDDHAMVPPAKKPASAKKPLPTIQQLITHLVSKYKPEGTCKHHACKKYAEECQLARLLPHSFDEEALKRKVHDCHTDCSELLLNIGDIPHKVMALLPKGSDSNRIYTSSVVIPVSNGQRIATAAAYAWACISFATLDQPLHYTLAKITTTECRKGLRILFQDVMIRYLHSNFNFMLLSSLQCIARDLPLSEQDVLRRLEAAGVC